MTPDDSLNLRNCFNAIAQLTFRIGGSARSITMSDKMGYTLVPRLIVLKFIVVLGMGMAIGGCYSSSQPARLRVSMLSMTGQIRSIEQVAQPSQIGKTVYVQGTVGDRIPLVEGSVYEVTDGTGTLWVVSNDDAQDIGNQVLLRGKVAYEATPELGDGAGEIYLWEINKYESRSNPDDLQ